LRQLNQRITARYHLKMLNPRETAQYINHRLRVAGGRKKLRFTRSAIRAIFRASGGTPRVINALCDRALLIGYTLETRDITPGIIHRALREIRGEPIGHSLFRQAPLWRRMLSLAVLLALLMVGMGGYYLWYTERLDPSRAVPFTSGNAEISKETKALLVNLAGALANAEKHIEEMSAAQKAEMEAAKVVVPAAQPSPSEAPTQTPAAEATKTTFADWALAQDPAASLKTGMETLLGLWGTASANAQPANDTPEALATTGRLQGLSAEVLSPALDQLLALNLPAMVRFKFAEKTMWAGVTELWEDGVVLKTPGESYKLSRGDFRDCYDGVEIAPAQL
jgi:general secretion pathway protein A